MAVAGADLLSRVCSFLLAKTGTIFLEPTSMGETTYIPLCRCDSWKVHPDTYASTTLEGGFTLREAKDKCLSLIHI